MSQRFAIIGLGQFGSRLAMNLAAMGREVIAIDKRRDRVEAIRDRVTLAVVMDAADEEALKAQGIDKVDVAIVGIGEGFEPVVLATTVLKQLGVDRVISRAMSPTQADILKRIGADEIVAPEDESADRWAARLYSPFFLSQFSLDDRHSIVELPMPKDWVGKTLIELRPRNELGVHVLALKRLTRGEDGEPSQPRFHIPEPDKPLKEDDLLVLMGDDEALERVPHD